VHTSWVEPDPDYEEAMDRFVRGILADPTFVDGLEDFLAGQRLVERGRVNSLAQTALLLTCPGVPDIYQGTEVWDSSLVDPDNRRPVDFELRTGLLDRITTTPGPPPVASDSTGATKLRLISRLLLHRRDHPALHRPRTYEPLETLGSQAARVVSFTTGGLCTVVPRLVMGRTDPDPGTTVALPRGRWVDVLSGAAVDGGTVPVAALLGSLPVAVLARAGS
jgi:(1->4)-alpha-D-glucan 1-alpha-D-glucosylmutase